MLHKERKKRWRYTTDTPVNVYLVKPEVVAEYTAF